MRISKLLMINVRAGSVRELCNLNQPVKPAHNSQFIIQIQQGQVWLRYELSGTRGKDLPLPTTLKNADIECSRFGPSASMIYNKIHNVCFRILPIYQRKKPWFIL